MEKALTVFKAFTGAGTLFGAPALPPGFEPCYGRDWNYGGRWIQTGWFKTVRIPVEDKNVRLMDVFIDKDRETDLGYKATVDFSAMFSETGSSLASPQDILELFPLGSFRHGNGKRLEGDWKDTPLEALENVDADASKVIRLILDAYDKRHERMMPVFEIWAAFPETDARLCDGETGAGGVRHVSPKVRRLAEGAKGDDFMDAVARWRLSNPTIPLDSGFRFLPSREDAERWIEQENPQRGCGFIVKEEQKEEKKDAEN